MSTFALPKLIVGAGPGEGVGIVSGTDPAATPPNPEATPPEGGAAAATPEPAGTEGPTLNQFGYPDGVPLIEMTAEHQAAYWKRMSRKHEQRADEALNADEAKALRDELAALKNASLSAEQVAAQQQVEQARQEARDAAVAELMPIIHESQLVGYGSTVISGERLQAWVSSANPAHFVGEDGAIDGEKVRTHLTALFGEKDPTPPAPKQKYPNFGQGAPVTGGAKPQRGLAGLAEAQKRFQKAA